MQRLRIPYLKAQGNAYIEDIAVQLDQFKQNALGYSLWESPKIKPKAHFVLAYNYDNFFLKFYVEEPYVKALHKDINSEVYRDSCVEIFMSFGQDTNYYNLEFNCAGTCLGQFGPNKEFRNFLPADVLAKIETRSYFGRSGTKDLHQWELTIKVPNNVFIYHSQQNVYQNDIRLNCYKCGDDLEEKHYLAWNNLLNPEPNFHLPAQFGTGYFESPTL